VIGANSDCLNIYADGGGKVSISGAVNLVEVKALNNVRVYVNQVLSHHLNVFASQKAQVGLAGSAQTVDVNSHDVAFIGAKYLCANTALVRTNQLSHVNIAADGKIFAESAGNSSVYFFGSPNILTSFLNENGTVIFLNDSPNSCPISKSKGRF
jgi:hypothetical protein